MEISEKTLKNLNTKIIELADEVCKMKRMYEDLLYNLDDDNFSGRFLKEKDGMKTKITANEKGITAVVGKIKDTEDSINGNYEELSSRISQTAESISTEVKRVLNLSGAIAVDSVSDMTDTGKIYALKGFDGLGHPVYKDYYAYNFISGEFELLSSDTVYSFFEQTADGFKIRGDVLINGNLVRTTDTNGNILEFNNGFFNMLVPDNADTPKMQIGFGTDDENVANPYIIFGAGDGNTDLNIHGYPLKSGTGLIYKHSGGMQINYTTRGLEIMGFDFSEDNTLRIYGDVVFDGSVNLGESVSATAVFG